ncbi:MAG: hypothetical protein VR68_05985 [Peptococcaceae bacterium BRH_c4a]|nr:MAG: hypothetical protein VR68_05985 [Peptococcaceae bacterium BRH_c4a]
MAISGVASPLAGQFVVVDPGHGGYDPGAVRGGVLEKEINLQIALKLKKYLEETGARVILTRCGDYNLAVAGLHKREAHRYDLSKRLEMMRQSNACLFVSIHANCMYSRTSGGPEVFYHQQSEDGKMLAECIQEELRSIPGVRKRLCKTSNYYVLHNAGKPAVLVEVGFISNPSERKRLTGDEYQNLLCQRISWGIMKFRVLQQLESR